MEFSESDIDRAMKFPEHKCALHLTHNEHKSYYETVEQWFENLESLHEIDISAEDKAECIRTGEVWSLQWYPDTPIGSYQVIGPTLKRVLELANEGN